MSAKMMTRAEIEFHLAKKYVGQVITYTDIRNRIHVGKVHRLAVENFTGELMVIFILGHDKQRHECDIYYFSDNTVLNGNTRGTNTGPAGV